jgi:cytidylate kinase
MPLITITSGIGCGEMAIARLVADGLKLELYDDRRLQEEAIKMGISSGDLKGLDEKAPGLFSRLLSHKPQTYLDLMDAIVYEVARRGEGIILGHGAQMLLRDFGCALHVRIYASQPSRIQHLKDQQGMSREAAEKMIYKSDSDRRGFLQFAFHIDWNDPSLYDIIINTDKLAKDSAARLVMEAAQSGEVKACSIAALDAMDRLSLLKRVQAAIMKNSLNPLDFQVEVPEKGVVQITGSINPLESKDRLLEAVKAVPGVSDVRSDIVIERIHDI